VTTIPAGRFYVSATASLENTAQTMGMTSPRANVTCQIVNSSAGTIATTNVVVPPAFNPGSGYIDGTIDATLQAWQTSNAASSTDTLQCSTLVTNVETQAASGVATSNITALSLSGSSVLG